MRALVCREFGTPDTLVIEDVDDPVPGDRDVLIDVHAAGINFPDMLAIAGKYQVRSEPPFIPGFEASGVISATGAAVTRLKRGDPVVVTPAMGAFAEKVAVPESQVFPLPRPLNFEQAAGFPITCCTSYHALRDCADIRSGESLLVLGAAGGVGTAAVEIGKAMGARVIAAAGSADKLSFALSLGADETVNYVDDNLRDAVKALTAGSGVDVVYDPVGGDLAEQALRSCAWQARYLVIGFASGGIPAFPANLALLKEASIKGVFWGQWAARHPADNHRNLGEISALLESGRLLPKITHAYALEDYARAYADLAGRRTNGKTVFRVR
jgi:NADPH2:quinone reductase